MAQRPPSPPVRDPALGLGAGGQADAALGGRKGQTPALHEEVPWNRFPAIGALGWHRRRKQVRLFLSLRPHAIRADDIVASLRSLRRHVRGKVVWVWGNLPVHRSRAVRQYLQAQRRWPQVEWLPAYAPELNPPEDVWANLDGRELGMSQEGRQQLRTAADAACTLGDLAMQLVHVIRDSTPRD